MDALATTDESFRQLMEILETKPVLPSSDQLLVNPLAKHKYQKTFPADSSIGAYIAQHPAVVVAYNVGVDEKTSSVRMCEKKK